MGFRIKGYTGNVDVPDLPDMDIDNDIADITWAQRYQESVPEFPEPKKSWAMPGVDANGRRNGKLVAIVRH